MKKREKDPFELFRESTELADKIWSLLKKWSDKESGPDAFCILSTPGIIAMNVPEKRRRRLFREDPMVGHFARGSLFEAKTLLIMAKNKRFLSEQEFDSFIEAIECQLEQISNCMPSGGFRLPFES